MVSPLETPRSSLAATKAADNIEPIVALARDGTDEQKQHAVKVLNLLAMKADLQEALAKAATKELLSLAPHENKTISNYALTALLNLADNKAAARTIVEHRGVEHISNLLSPSLIPIPISHPYSYPYPYPYPYPCPYPYPYPCP